MKRLILRNSRGGISINVDIEVVPLCICRVSMLVYLLSQLHQAMTRSNYTKHRFYGDIHIVFQSSAFTQCIC